jgi:hypothetical protein
MSTDFMNLHRPGIGNASSFQVSGIPWVSSSLAVPANTSAPLEISFPQVTKSIIVKNVSTGSVQMRVGFSANGVVNSNNYFILSGGESFAADLKVTRIYLLSNTAAVLTGSVIAGLTKIPSNELPNNWSGSAGVG